MTTKCTCGLSELRIFLDIRKLVRAGAKDCFEIARKLGLYKTGRQKRVLRREYVQVRVWLSFLPAFVQAEYVTMLADKASSPVRWSHIPRLYSTYSSEFMEYGEEIGPRFRAEWGRIFDIEKEV